MSGNVAPNIVTDGLVLYLDAANTKSYPGSGTAWNDIASGVITGSLTNGPTYSSANGGSIVFDGTNDYISLPSSSLLSNSGFSYSIWAQQNGTGVSGTRAIIISNRATYIDICYSSTNILFSLNLTNAQNLIIAVGKSVGIGPWAHYAATYDKQVAALYLNGTQIASANYNYDIVYPTSSFNFTIGQYDGGNYNLNGKIPSAQVYNRGLTAAEVLQNFNALRGRYGI